MNQPATTRLTSQPQANERRLRLVPNLSAHKPAPDRLRGKTACIVFDDRDYEGFSRTLRDFVDAPCDIQTIRWSELYSALPHLDTDILLIMSPRKLNGEFPDFRRALERFRDRNPTSVVSMNNLHSPVARETEKIESLTGLIDHVEHGFTYFPQLLELSASMHVARA